MDGNLSGILEFALAGSRFGLPVAEVVEVSQCVTIHPLPQAPSIVEGVINARGRVIPVVDIRSRFGLPAKGAEISDYLVLARAGSRIVALRVDRVIGLVQIDPGDVEAAEAITSRTGLTVGVARLPDRLILIQALAKFLSQAESEAVDRLEQHGWRR